MNIKTQFIPASRKLQRPGYSMNPQYITVHSTGNPASTAQNEADYVCKNSTRQASYHFVCDDKQIIQVLPTNEVAWHAGDGGQGTGNRKSVAIEICEAGDRKKAVDNAVWLTKKLMGDLNITADKVVQHNHWSGKNCPRILRDKNYIKNGIDWAYFTSSIREEEESEEEEVTQEQFDKMMDAYLAERAKVDPKWFEKDLPARRFVEDEKIMQGDEHGNMMYDAFATRAEIAQMMYNLTHKAAADGE